MNDTNFIELRVAYPGHPYVARIDGLNDRNELNRIWVGEFFYHRREQVDGGQEQVYRIPLVDAVYEIAETINGRRARRYVAVCQGTLHRLTRDSVEAIAEGAMTIQQWNTIATNDRHGDVL